MGAPVPLLLQPVCPPREDRSIAEFLETAVRLCSARSAELELEPEGGAPVGRYSLPVSGARDTTLVLDPGPDFEARLHLGGCAEPEAEISRLLAAFLATILDRHRLSTQTAILRAALDSTASSILLFDGRGEIVYANPPADRMLSLQTERDLLTEADGEERQPLFSLLCGLVERLVSTPGESSVWKGRLHTGDGELLACEVTRLPQREMRADAVVVLLQPIGSEPAIRLEDFASDHGLSRREYEVLRLLVEGATTATMADRLGISPHTVRDHLKNLYRKTATGSRSELVGLLSRGPRPGGNRGSR